MTQKSENKSILSHICTVSNYRLNSISLNGVAYTNYDMCATPRPQNAAVKVAYETNLWKRCISLKLDSVAEPSLGPSVRGVRMRGADHAWIRQRPGVVLFSFSHPRPSRKDILSTLSIITKSGKMRISGSQQKLPTQRNEGRWVVDSFILTEA